MGKHVFSHVKRFYMEKLSQPSMGKSRTAQMRVFSLKVDILEVSGGVVSKKRINYCVQGGGGLECYY